MYDVSLWASICEPWWNIKIINLELVKYNNLNENIDCGHSSFARGLLTQ